MKKQKEQFTIELSTFKKFISIVHCVLQVCHLHINKSGISVIGVDCANVAMVVASLRKFENYTCNGSYTLGIDVEQIYQILKPLEQSCLITVSWFRENELWKLGIKSDNFDIVFDLLNNKEIEKDPRPPILSFISEAIIDGEQFLNGIKIASCCSEKCAIDINKHNCTMIIKSAKAIIKYVIGNGAKLESRSKYSIDYLKDLIKVFEGTTIKIRMSTDYPISLSTEDLLPDGISVEYLLAPRVEME